MDKLFDLSVCVFEKFSLNFVRSFRKVRMNSHRRSPPNNLMKLEAEAHWDQNPVQNPVQNLVQNPVQNPVPKSGLKSSPKMRSEVWSKNIRSEIRSDIIVKEKRTLKKKRRKKDSFFHHNDEMAQCRTERSSVITGDLKKQAKKYWYSMAENTTISWLLSKLHSMYMYYYVSAGSKHRWRQSVATNFFGQPKSDLQQLGAVELFMWTAWSEFKKETRGNCFFNRIMRWVLDALESNKKLRSKSRSKAEWDSRQVFVFSFPKNL